jgi:very-short-patch-repair endonuclease
MDHPRRRPRALPELQRRAVTLRREQTPSEEFLWQHLRDRQIGGLKFRRQHIIKPFILDFFCSEYSLAIEIDGSIHDLDAAKIYDGTRQAKLEMQGVRFLRFSAERVMSDVHGVLKEIANACGAEYSAIPKSPSSYPSPHCMGRRDNSFNAQFYSSRSSINFIYLHNSLLLPLFFSPRPMQWEEGPGVRGITPTPRFAG